MNHIKSTVRQSSITFEDYDCLSRRHHPLTLMHHLNQTYLSARHPSFNFYSFNFTLFKHTFHISTWIPNISLFPITIITRPSEFTFFSTLTRYNIHLYPLYLPFSWDTCFLLILIVLHTTTYRICSRFSFLHIFCDITPLCILRSPFLLITLHVVLISLNWRNKSYSLYSKQQPKPGLKVLLGTPARLIKRRIQSFTLLYANTLRGT